MLCFKSLLTFFVYQTKTVIFLYNLNHELPAPKHDQKQFDNAAVTTVTAQQERIFWRKYGRNTF